MNSSSKSKIRTTLAIWNSGNKGKTESVREFAYALLSAYPNFRPIYPLPPVALIPSANDFRLIIEIDGQIIGIESLGDPKSDLEKRLHLLADFYICDLIICTCRTRGETVWAVESLEHKDFEIIWSSTYQLNGRFQQSVANTLKGQHILALLQTMGKI